MKISKVVWVILGGLVLVGLGFAVGYFVPFKAAVGPHPLMHLRGFDGGFGFPFMMMGLRGLFGLFLCLGPLAGIVALILVLTRRPAASPAPAASSTPPAAPSETSEQPTAASSKTSAKSK